jgi:hypothetical protein
MYIILPLLIILCLYLFYLTLNKKEKFTQNKCAFCIPLHPKHFSYGYEIEDALNGTDADLYFIFTDDAEKDSFYKYGQNSNYLVLSDFVNVKRLDRNRSWVSVKKLYALSKLYNRYEYISCIDSEVLFINTKFYKTMKNTANNKIICGGDISDSANRDYSKIMKESLTNIVPVKDRTRLKQISQEYSIYTWWSNLPVYDCSKARGFLEWIEFNNKDFIDKMTWYVFDDIVYNYYVILKYNYKLVVIPDINTSLEYAPNKLIQRVDKDTCKLYWVNYSQYKKDTEYYKNNNFIIAYHLDR